MLDVRLEGRLDVWGWILCGCGWLDWQALERGHDHPHALGVAEIHEASWTWRKEHVYHRRCRLDLPPISCVIVSRTCISFLNLYLFYLRTFEIFMDRTLKDYWSCRTWFHELETFTLFSTQDFQLPYVVKLSEERDLFSVGLFYEKHFQTTLI